jgi:hypothetical protein
MQTQQQVLTWIIGLGQSADANYEVRSICHSKLLALQTKLEAMVKNRCFSQSTLSICNRKN